MRPLNVKPPDSVLYDEAAQLTRVVGQQGAGRQGASQPQTRLLSVSQYAQEAQSLLDTHWVANGYRWTDESQKQLLELNLETLGNGWRGAARALVTQTGAFCAFCEAPLTAAPSVVHLLPARRFVTAAFAFSNLLLACRVCAELKGDSPDQKTVGQDTTAAASTLVDPAKFAWPSRYWSSMGTTAVLPFRYDLVVAQRAPETVEPLRLVLPAEYPALLEARREGRLVERSGLLELEQEDRPPTLIAAFIAPSGTDAGLRAGVQAVIDLLKLNQIVPLPGAPLDRRIAQRTLVFLDALNTHATLDVMARNPGGVPFDTLVNGLAPTMAATGFWGVWRTVLASLPGIEDVLARAFPGLPSTRWII